MEQIKFRKQQKLKVKFVSLESGITALGFRKIASLAKKLNPDTQICFIPVDNLYAILSHIFPTKKIGFDDKDVKIAARYLSEADLVCFSSMTASASHVEKIARAIKKLNPKTFLLLGGVHSIIFPHEAIKYVDAICTGEGEIPFQTFFKAYCSGRDYLSTQGMWFNTKKGIRKNKNLPLNNSELLNSFPYLYIDLNCQIYDLRLRKFRNFTKFDYTQYHGLTYRTIWSLGCPFSCIYCANDAFISLDSNYRRIRYSPVEHMIGEIENALNLHPYVTTIAFYDDNFIAIPPNVIKEFARLYKKRINLPFVVFGLHPNIITKEKIDILARAGMNRGRMGIQSGSKNTLAFYNRPTPLPKIQKSVKILAKACKKYKMIPPSYDIISDNPTETREDIINNLKFLYSLERPYTLTVFSLRVFAKTKLAEYFKKHPQFKIRREESSYLDTRKTMDNILLYILAAFKPPKFIFNKLLKSVRGYQEKQKLHPKLHLFAKSIYLITRGIQHLLKLDFTVVVGWWVYYIWRFGLVKEANKRTQ